MIFNPDIHHRKSIRLKQFDYAQMGAYFITLCADHRECRFGEIHDGALHASPLGAIALQEWQKLPIRWPQIILDAFVVMPNHIHGIFWLSTDVGATLAVAQKNMNVTNDDSQEPRATARVAPTVGQVIGVYKSLVFQQCLAWAKNTDTNLGKLWQRNYWDRVIRNEHELSTLRQYIYNNPASWELDSLNQGNINSF